MKENTYTKFVPDKLVKLVGMGAALLASRLLAFEGDDGYAVVGANFFCDLFGWSKNTYKSYAKKLAIAGVWHQDTSNTHRGSTTIWKKGSNFDTFFTEKGSNFDRKRGQFLTEKGSIFDPYNKVNNKEGIKACTRTRETRPQTSTLKKELNMDLFIKFWSGYKAARDFENERERCENTWRYMPEALKKEIADGAATAKVQKNPYWYLRDYKPKNPALAAIGSTMTFAEYYARLGTTEPLNGWVLIKPQQGSGIDKCFFRKEH